MPLPCVTAGCASPPAAPFSLPQAIDDHDCVWALASLWLGLAFLASLLSIGSVSRRRFRNHVGTARNDHCRRHWRCGARHDDLGNSVGAGAIVLTFLAGAELDPRCSSSMEGSSHGRARKLLFSIFGMRGRAHICWMGVMPSWLAELRCRDFGGCRYAVMLEFGFNKTEYGKTILAACFVTDSGRS